VSNKKLLLQKIRSNKLAAIEYILSWGIPNFIPYGEPHKAVIKACEKVRMQKELVKLGKLDPKEAKEGVIIQFARNHSKTTIVLGYILTLLGENPNLRIKIVCESEQMARQRIKFLKTHLERNPRLRQLYPHLKPADTESWSSQQLYVERELISPDPSVEAYGVLSAATGSHCVVEGTPIITSKGLKPIEEIKKGDFVFSITGKFERVIATMNHHYKGKVYHIQSAMQNFATVKVTSNHKILVRYIENNIPKVEWVEAEKIAQNPKKYMLAFPKARFVGTHKVFSNKERQRQFEKLYYDTDFWRFLGYYLAEGCLANWIENGTDVEMVGKKNGYRVILSFGKHEQDYINDVVSILNKFGIRAKIYQTQTTTQVVFHDKFIWQLLTTFGHKAPNKILPTWVISASKKNKYEFLKGYIRGDGCKVRNKINITTSSQHIATMLPLLVSDFDCLPSIVRSERKKQFIQGRKINSKQVFNIRLSFKSEERFLTDLLFKDKKHNYKPTRWKSDDLFYYIPIRKIEEKEYDGIVYDIQVKNGHSFCCPFLTLSNCDLIVFDDIIGQRNALVYPENLKKVEEAFYNTWMNVLDSPGGWFIYIFTPYKEGELSLKLKERTDLYEVVEYIVDDKLTPIWPEWMDREALKKKLEEIGPTAFARAYQGKVASDRDFVFNRNAIERCYDFTLSFGETKDNWIYVMGVDLAAGRTKQSARNVIFTLAMDEKGHRIPVSIKIGRWDSVTTAKMILNEYERFKHKIIKIENNAYQQALIDWINAISGSVDLPIEGYRTGNQKFDPEKGLPSMAAEFEKGLWRIPMKDEHPDGCDCSLCVWLEELKTFPHSKFSDTVMASFFAREAAREIVGSDTVNISFIDIKLDEEEFIDQDETFSIYL